MTWKEKIQMSEFDKDSNIKEYMKFEC